MCLYLLLKDSFFCKRHDVTSLDVVPFDVHPSASLNKHTDSDTSQGQDEADSLLEELYTDSSLEED